jgi:hypothetical protein
MPSNPSANPHICSGRFLKRAPLSLFLLCTLASAQTPKPASKKLPAATRANELTLAGLRPGRDNSQRAVALYKNSPFESKLEETQASWHFPCNFPETLTLDLDAHKGIQVIRVTQGGTFTDCEPKGRVVVRSNWRTGLGLRVGDPAAKVSQLYGEPDSKSPSSKGGQQLELWYYAFDWAGADVPQVMEVLCTKEKDGKPGQVIEITLAAPSL